MTQKPKPILLNAEMVRAILDGGKTQTRRPIKPQPGTGQYVDSTTLNTTGWIFREPGEAFDPVARDNARCPFGKPGQLLYMRETWRVIGQSAGEWCKIEYRADGQSSGLIPLQEPVRKRIGYSRGYWRPSIHMPKWASRITLRVKRVWVERVQDVSEADAYAEGIDTESEEYNLCVNILDNLGVVDGATHGIPKSSAALGVFSMLWDSIYGYARPKKHDGIITHYESFPWSVDTRDERETVRGLPHRCYPNPWIFGCEFEVSE